MTGSEFLSPPSPVPPTVCISFVSVFQCSGLLAGVGDAGGAGGPDQAGQVGAEELPRLGAGGASGAAAGCQVSNYTTASGCFSDEAFLPTNEERSFTEQYLFCCIIFTREGLLSRQTAWLAGPGLDAWSWPRSAHPASQLLVVRPAPALPALLAALLNTALASLPPPASRNSSQLFSQNFQVTHV